MFPSDREEEYLRSRIIHKNYVFERNPCYEISLLVPYHCVDCRIPLWRCMMTGRNLFSGTHDHPPPTNNRATTIDLTEECGTTETAENCQSTQQETVTIDLTETSSGTDEEIEADKCLWCKQNFAIAVFIPCRHLGLCWECMGNLCCDQMLRRKEEREYTPECTICKKLITGILRMEKKD